MKTRRGFGLVELLIALAIFAVVLASVARLMQDNRRKLVIAQIKAEYVHDLPILARALRAYVDGTKATWAPGSVNVVTLTTLRTGGFLPTSFGARTTGDGTTPMGNAYTMVAVKAATGADAPAVVAELGTALAARLEAAGLAADATGMVALKREIAAAVGATGLPSATIGAGTTVATSAGSNGWTKALGSYFPTAPSQPAVAALVGFADLEPDGGGGNNGSGSPMSDYKQCKVWLGNKFGTSGSCATSWTEINRWTSCQTSGTLVPLPEVGSALTFGTQHISLGQLVTAAEFSVCKGYCSASPSCLALCESRMESLNSTGDAYTENSQVSVNNVIVASGFCRARDCRPSSAAPGNYLCSGDWVPAGVTDVFCCEPQ